MRKKLKSLFVTLTIVIIISIVQSWSTAGKEGREFYQLTIYHFNTAAQEKMIDSYLQSALLPALHRMNIKNIGVFKNHANDTIADRTLYVLIPIQTLDDVIKMPGKLESDKVYQTAGADYINAVYTTPPYKRKETILLQAFTLVPKLQTPAFKGSRRDRIYELRSYESATEKIFQNKVRMFNEGDEIGLFKRLNFNASFYGEVIAGGKMPNLMYMTCHENKMVRDSNWKAFVGDPYWKKLSTMPEYSVKSFKNAVLVIFLRFFSFFFGFLPGFP